MRTPGILLFPGMDEAVCPFAPGINVENRQTTSSKERCRFINSSQNLDFAPLFRRISIQSQLRKIMKKASSLTMPNVQRIEAGEINILLTTARRLKTALGCSWDDLMEK
jgi:hypothetical protein